MRGLLQQVVQGMSAGRPQQARQTLRKTSCSINGRASSTDTRSHATDEVRRRAVPCSINHGLASTRRRLGEKRVMLTRWRSSFGNTNYGVVIFLMLVSVLAILRSEVVLRMSSNPHFLYLGYQCQQKYDCKVSPRPKRVAHYVYDEAKQIYAMSTPVDSTPQQRLVEPLGNLRRQERIKATKNYVEGVDAVETDDCKLRYDWQKSFRPTCNTLHEFDLSTPRTPINGTVNTKYRIIGNGYWRDVWVANNAHEKLVFKSMRYEHDFTLRNFDRMRRDAAVMDRLSFSNYIIDLYGFCGTSSFSEYGDGGDVLAPLENGLTQRERLQIGTFLLQHLTAGRYNVICSPCCSYHYSRPSLNRFGRLAQCRSRRPSVDRPHGYCAGSIHQSRRPFQAERL
jgi:hypothetical protein